MIQGVKSHFLSKHGSVKLTWSSLLLLLVLISPICNASPAHISQYPEIYKFIQEMVDKYQFNKKNLDRIFNDVQLRPDVIAAMNKPAESFSWDRYHSLFITHKRIRLGVEFWQMHAKTLELAQKRYGVPPSIIIAIIGVETFYGGNTGDYRVIDTLSTLAFAYPPRKKFFRNELKEYLFLTRDLGLDPLELRGSYAGAIGLPQFMPSSYRSYAVGYNGARIDLLNNPEHAILSVANYLKKHGWQPNQAIATRAQIKQASGIKLVQNSGKPQMALATFARHGVYPSNSYPKQQKAALIQLVGKKAPEYWLTFANFYSIITYNSSVNYAMAVYQLSQAIAQQRQKKLATSTPPAKQPQPTVHKPKVNHKQAPKKLQSNLTNSHFSVDEGIRV